MFQAMRRIAAVVLGAWLVACTAETLDLVSLQSTEPNAVCNDGSPSGYYWKAGEPGTLRWIVDLQGGGWCTDERECKSRCPPGNMDSKPLCSSMSWGKQTTFSGGLMAPKNDTMLYGANKAFIKYCTSDAHMGNADAFGLKFRGAVVVQAVLKDMVQRGLGQGSKRHQLIFGGQSAGGRGAMVHLEYVHEMLGSIAGANTDVFGLLDSPLYLDIPAYPGSGFKGFAAECKGVHSFANVQHVGKACMAVHAAEPWKCIMGQYRMPQVKTPYMLVAAEYDAFQLGRNKITPLRLTVAKRKYAEDFAAKTAALAKNLSSSWPANSTWPNAIYSRACYEHATSLSIAGFDKSFTIKDKKTLDAAMAVFLKDSGNSSEDAYPWAWVDDCQGFACGGSDCKILQALDPFRNVDPVEVIESDDIDPYFGNDLVVV